MTSISLTDIPLSQLGETSSSIYRSTPQQQDNVSPEELANVRTSDRETPRVDSPRLVPSISEHGAISERVTQRVKVTPWRLANTLVILAFGLTKAVYSYQGYSTTPTTLDWLAGVWWTLIVYWVEIIRTDTPNAFPWFLHHDLYVSGSLNTPLTKSILAIMFFLTALAALVLSRLWNALLSKPVFHASRWISISASVCTGLSLILAFRLGRKIISIVSRRHVMIRRKISRIYSSAPNRVRTAILTLCKMSMDMSFYWLSFTFAFALAFDVTGEIRPRIEPFAAQTFPWILILYLVGFLIDRLLGSWRSPLMEVVSNGLQLVNEIRAILRTSLCQLSRRFNRLIGWRSEGPADGSRGNQALVP